MSQGADEEVSLDLTKIEPNATPGSPKVGKQLLGPRRIDDLARVGLAFALVAILAILILGTGWFVVAYPKKEPAVESFLKLVFTPVVGLVGSVIGFYFGSRGSSGDG